MMEKIKLYTESQMKQAMLDARISPWLKIDFLLWDYTPIELPSDEEIEERIKNFIRYDDIFFKAGVNWVLEQIKQQADEKQRSSSHQSDL